MNPLLWCIALLFVFFLGLIIGGWIEHKIIVRQTDLALASVPKPERYTQVNVPVDANEGDRWYNMATGRDYIFQNGQWIGCTIVERPSIYEQDCRWRGEAEEVPVGGKPSEDRCNCLSSVAGGVHLSDCPEYPGACNHQWVQQRPGSVEMECKHCGVKV